MAKTHLPLNRDAIAKRIKDEVGGTTNPPVDFGSPSSKKEPQPAPDISELGVLAPARRRLERLIAANLNEAKELVEMITVGGFGHLGLGLIERAAKKAKDPLSEDIKQLADEEVGLADENPCFSVQGIRVARYVTYRESFDKEALRRALLRLGVQSRIINEAMAEAGEGKKKPVFNLRISETGEDE